ncbi:MAG: MgtC/SapB family protein [Pseudomonadales bacterium]|jgi:putative Mg2+ transporter-C (MgtC) family protein|nr:MgtC/SapB family protein [Pseudomonadales bacterium]
MNALSALLSIDPFEWSSVGTALLCGALIGVERQLRGKPIGIRTSALIVLATYMFVKVSLQLDSDNVDPSRTIGQVVTGVGFLGAGVIMTRHGAVHGVTSAAAIWVLAALGVCIATGHELSAIKLSLVALFILWIVHALEKNNHVLRRGVHRIVEYRPENDEPPQG